MKTPKHYFMCRASFEGANIGVWIGFKHLIYLMEEAIWDYFRSHNLSAKNIYFNYGGKISIRNSQIEIFKAVTSDDWLKIEVFPDEVDNKIKLLMFNANKELMMRGVFTVTIDLCEKSKSSITNDCNYEFIRPYIQQNAEDKETSIAKIEKIPIDRIFALRYRASDLFVYQQNIPYFYCRYSKYLGHSGLLRIVENIVDRFLEYKGLSIPKILEEKGLIPIVTKCEISQWASPLMGETLFSVFRIKEMYRDVIYVANIDFWVNKSNSLVYIGTCDITHGYAKIDSKGKAELAIFDDYILKSLKDEF